MTNGRKERVVIVGGGMASLAAAYHLSATPDMRAKYDVTLYQMGWRLGGKCASSRDENLRNVEHGLHVWFGCYDNAFCLMRSVYNEWRRVRKPSLSDVFKPRLESHIGTSADDNDRWIHVFWPDAAGLPWEAPDPQTLTANAIAERLVDHVREIVLSDDKLSEACVDEKRSLGPAEMDACVELAAARQSTEAWLNEDRLNRASTYLELAQETIAGTHTEDREPTESINAAASARTLVMSAIDSLVESQKKDATAHYLIETIELARALIVGLITDLIIGGETLEALDEQEFRDWLVAHGASRETVETSPILKSLYDTMFQYPAGDQEKPSYAAGTAIQVLTRILATYRGAPLYMPQHGLGEIVIAPLYEVLSQNGVTFEFFHKLSKISPAVSKTEIDTLVFERQATPKNEHYNPGR